MKGTLHKTESGWQVWYHAKDELYHGSIRVRILPLHPDEPMLVDKRWEGQEVEFEIFDNRERCNCICHKDSSIMHFMACCNDGYKTDNLGHVNYYAKIVDKATRPLTEDDAWITMKEGDITVNFKPMPEFDDPKYPEVKIICPRCKDIMPCECNPTRQISLLNSVRANPSWDTIIREFHLATQQVPIGAPPLIFECWLVENYNPPTKKEDHDK